MIRKHFRLRRFALALAIAAVAAPAAHAKPVSLSGGVTPTLSQLQAEASRVYGSQGDIPTSSIHGGRTPTMGHRRLSDPRSRIAVAHVRRARQALPLNVAEHRSREHLTANATSRSGLVLGLLLAVEPDHVEHERPGAAPSRALIRAPPVDDNAARWTFEKNERYRHLELPDDLFAAIVATLPPREDRDLEAPCFLGSTRRHCGPRSRALVRRPGHRTSRRTGCDGGEARCTTSAQAHSPRWPNCWATPSASPSTTTSTRSPTTGRSTARLRSHVYASERTVLDRCWIRSPKNAVCREVRFLHGPPREAPAKPRFRAGLCAEDRDLRNASSNASGNSHGEPPDRTAERRAGRISRPAPHFPERRACWRKPLFGSGVRKADSEERHPV